MFKFVGVVVIYGLAIIGASVTVKKYIALKRKAYPPPCQTTTPE